MTRDHSLIEELMAAEALGGLDPQDRDRLERERAAHGECEECSRIETTFSETAGRMAFALDPVAVRGGMADEVLESAAQSPSGGEAPSDAAIVDLRGRRGRLTGGRRAIVAVAAAAALLVGSVALGRSVGGPPTSIAVPGQHVVRFSGAGGELAMAYTPGEAGAVLIGSGFADPGEGKAYEIWAIRDGTPISGGCAVPAGGTLATVVRTPVEPTDVMAVTVESTSCPAAPTTQPILVADLSKLS